MKNIRLHIEQAGNGGWIVWNSGDPQFQSVPIAALSNTADLLAWLTNWLNAPATK